MPFQIGRRAELSLTLTSKAISGLHCEIFERDGALWISDSASTNGTYVNGERILGERQLGQDDLLQFADLPFRLSAESPVLDSRTLAEDHCDHALALVQLDTLLEKEEVTPYYQPIVDSATGETVAYEALARSRMIGLETPAAMFNAAAQLDVEADVSRLMRIKGIECCGAFAEPPHLYLNTHPAELLKNDFHEAVAEKRILAPFQQLTLEIHEAALTDIASMIELREQLQDLDINLAFDDFGAGQARIAEIAEVRPQCVKFDRKMIQDIDIADDERRSLVITLRDIGVIPLAEGVETEAEAETSRQLGFPLAQGFHYSKPAPVKQFAEVLVNVKVESLNLRPIQPVS